MKYCRSLFPVLLSLVFCLALGVAAAAQPPAPVEPLPAAAPKNPLLTPITQQIQSLIGATPLTPLVGPPAPPAPTEEQPIPEPVETFGTRALNLIISALELVRVQATTFVTDFSALPQLSDWLEQQRTNPRLQAQWGTIGNDLLTTIGIPFLAAFVLEFLLYPARRKMRGVTPNNYGLKFTNVIGLLILMFLPVLVFIAASLILVNQTEMQKLSRFVILNVVYAITLARLAIVTARALLAPQAPALRVVPATTENAIYAYHWISAFSIFIIGGYFFVDLARTVRAPAEAITAFGNLLGFALVLMAMIVIVQKRAFISVLLRGNLSAVQRDLTLWQGLRLWFARQWHVLAVAYLIIGYGIAVLGLDNGFALMLRGTILTLAILVTMRIVFDGINRWSSHVPQGSVSHIRSILRCVLQITVWILAVFAALAAWGVDVAALFLTPFGQRITGAAFSIGSTILIVSFIYEAIHSAIERNLNRHDEEDKVVEVSGRMRTLAPMLRHAAIIIFGAVIIFVVLSEAGINVGPLLAGAGILGVAIGFGSQALVKDFLTGLSIVIEDTIAVGDVVQIGSHKGVVEDMSIRTLRLRDADGALHILPFSEVTQIINMTKDFSYAVIDVGVAYDSDLDHVMNVIRAVGEDLQNDPIFKRVILEPVEILGVENLGEFSITIRSRVRTRPGKHWDVKRMYLLKLKQRFDKEGIEIPYPTVMQLNRTPAA